MQLKGTAHLGPYKDVLVPGNSMTSTCRYVGSIVSRQAPFCREAEEHWSEQTYVECMCRIPAVNWLQGFRIPSLGS